MSGIVHATVATGTDAGTGDIHKAQWNAEHSRPYPLDRYAIDGTYGDDFTAGSLSGSWTRRNYTSGAETYQVGIDQTYLRIAKSGRAAGDGYFKTAPAGDWTFAMKFIPRFLAQNAVAWGLGVVDTNGTGVSTCFYNSPISCIEISTTTYSTYGGSFHGPGGDATIFPIANIFGDQPIWVYLRKSGTSYFVAYSADGEAWSPESASLTWSGTVDRMAMMDAPLGTANLGYIDVDWFNKIA